MSSVWLDFISYFGCAVHQLKRTASRSQLPGLKTLNSLQTIHLSLLFCPLATRNAISDAVSSRFWNRAIRTMKSSLSMMVRQMTLPTFLKISYKHIPRISACVCSACVTNCPKAGQANLTRSMQAYRNLMENGCYSPMPIPGMLPMHCNAR